MKIDDDLPSDIVRSAKEVPVGHVIKTEMTDYEVVKCIPHPSGGWQVFIVAIALHAIDIESGRRISA